MDLSPDLIPFDHVPKLTELSASGANAAVAAAVAVGTLYCFLGYRVLKFIIGLTGFILAGASAAFLAGWLSQGNPIAMAAGAVLGGLAGAMALFFLYHVGIFSLGLLAGILIAFNVLADSVEPWAPWAILGAGAAGGLVALLIERPVIPIATGALGAWMVVCGIAHFLLGPDFLTALRGPLQFGETRWYIVVSWAVLAVAGTLAQFATYRRPRTEIKEVVVREVER
ncbi:MAG: DUF4203 domain-containing protein [Candidatus Hydrogenedentes bacterium]|nr:DUF4203 domain-containing protein [Candidatus Hydrogenedentota bacterium]